MGISSININTTDVGNLDPYIPTWLTTAPANHRPANFWKKQNKKQHWNEIVKSVAISGWTDEDQLQI